MTLSISDCTSDADSMETILSLPSLHSRKLAWKEFSNSLEGLVGGNDS